MLDLFDRASSHRAARGMIAVEGPQVAIAFLTLRTGKVAFGRVSGDVRLSDALCDLIEERIERRIVDSGW